VKVLVVGAGAVGSLFGARFVQAGHSVELVGRPEHVAAIRANGLWIRGVGEVRVAIAARSELPAPVSADAVLLTVKTFDLPQVAETLGRATPTPLPTLLTQNGLGVEDAAVSGLTRGGWPEPAAWTVRAVHSVPATFVAPGEVRAAGTGEVLLPDPARSGALAPRIQLFRVLLAGAGFSVRLVTDFEREVWRKALVNAAINPLTAVRGVTNGQLLTEPARTEALALLAEARSVARAEGFDFSESETREDFERVARATADNRSSMLQDLDRGRPTEVEAISGELLRRGAAHRLDLPATRGVVEQLRSRFTERSRRPQPS
jgi:2-dehydropantoate 2-reductase